MPHISIISSGISGTHLGNKLLHVFPVRDFYTSLQWISIILYVHADASHANLSKCMW